MAVNREALAWAAGFFDGEGTTGICRQAAANRKAQLSVQVSQVDREPLDRFKDAVGGLGRVTGPYPKRSPKGGPAQDQWLYHTRSFETGQAVVAMLWPFLSSPKRRQADAALREMAVWQAGCVQRADTRRVSQYRGVAPYRNGKWRAYIGSGGRSRQIHLGVFATEAEAWNARLSAQREQSAT